MNDKRLPSFNDFSPGLFPDLRMPLREVDKHAGNRDLVVEAISALNGWPVANKRAKNVLITLQNTGLMDQPSCSLTALGITVMNSASEREAAQNFCKHILQNMNGRVLIEAVRGLRKRGERVTKASLKGELERLGITDLATATTDHLTLKNWMSKAGVLTGTGNEVRVDDAELKKLIGISSEEAAELEGLEIAQRIFALILRRMALTEKGWISTQRVISECLRDHPKLFTEDQMRRKVLEPLEAAGWITTGGGSAGRGAKSGNVMCQAKLLDIPLKYIAPSLAASIPPDLRPKIDTPLSKLREMLDSSSKHQRGLGLELLALRMILDLSLTPRGFRKRAKSTGYAEVDVIAEGTKLLFSRWTFQCKAVAPTAKVDIEDVAREVGIAIHGKAHVVTMVSTGSFTSKAIDFAREITSSTHLQFLFLDGKVVREYLRLGATKLIEHVLLNAADVMQQKGDQLPPPILGVLEEGETASGATESGTAD